MKISIILRIMLVFSISQSDIGIIQAQTVPTPEQTALMYNDVVTMSLGPGTILSIYPLTGYYEHLFLSDSISKKITTFIDVGGGLAANGSGGSYVITFMMSRFGMLTGSNKHHLESSIGLCYFFDYSDYSGFQPAFTLGYRSQKPGRHYIFRAGVGMPEQLYFGWGVSF